MAKLALAVIRMTGDVMCVLVLMLMPAATLIMHMLFVLVMMMLMATATLIVIMLIVLMVMMLMLIATAVIVLFRGMLMRMAAAITMAMLRDMPHAAMIVVLATVTTGAAFGMVTIIFIPLNMSVHMSKAAHLLGGITHFF